MRSGPPSSLWLVPSRTFVGGVVVLTYRPSLAAALAFQIEPSST
jgi:hypothetical protein